jgi:hypothetical protein
VAALVFSCAVAADFDGRDEQQVDYFKVIFIAEHDGGSTRRGVGETFRVSDGDFGAVRQSEEETAKGSGVVNASKLV